MFNILAPQKLNIQYSSISLELELELWTYHFLSAESVVQRALKRVKLWHFTPGLACYILFYVLRAQVGSFQHDPN